MLLLSTQKVADDSTKKAVGADLHSLGNIGNSTINKTAGPTLESAMPGTRATWKKAPRLDPHSLRGAAGAVEAGPQLVLVVS